MAATRRRQLKVMSLFTLFGYDVRAWKRIHILGGTPNEDLPITFKEALKLTWKYPALRATFIYRLSHWCYRQHIRVLPGILWRMNIRHFGLDIAPSVSIGPGLHIAHPVGTAVMARSLGRNVSLIASVTIGMGDTYEFPIIGSDVTVSAGARVLGGIVVGDGSTIGANAVVMEDVPPGATMMGNPARPITLKEAFYPGHDTEIFADL